MEEKKRMMTEERGLCGAIRSFRVAPIVLLFFVAGAIVPTLIPDRVSGEAEQRTSGRAKLQVGVAAVEMVGEDSMPVGGGIGPRYVKGLDAPLRATALVLKSDTTVCLISVDLVKLHRDVIDEVMRRIETSTHISFNNILLSSTHTHSAPATSRVHGVTPDPVFLERVKAAIVTAAEWAAARLRPAELDFALGHEATVGQNSRLLLSDGTIYWVGPKDDAVRPTGPFDPQLPVLAFKGLDGKPISILFNHSSHNIGARGNKRSPAFYGLAAQELEKELGGTHLYFPGAIGSTHVYDLTTEERIFRIKQAIREALAVAERRDAVGIRSVKREIEYRVRTFDEAKEDQAVSAYCRKRSPNGAERTIQIFRDMRQELMPHQGEIRKTWLHILTIGDIAFVGVPGQLFTNLGMEIKRRSQFRYTYIIGLANDEIGYLAERRDFELGGYQLWTGLHSFSAEQTGSEIVDQAVKMLGELFLTRVKKRRGGTD
jgi:neutral ceramidase